MDRPIDDSATYSTPDQPVAELIDSVCDSFELAWRSGDAPDIERYLQDQRVANDTRVTESTLLVELVLIDVEYRRRRGDAAAPEEYLSKFPRLHEAVGTAFARMETILADVSPERPLHPMLGRFELLEPLGQGAFGVVWKAQDLRMRRLVAIKQLRGNISDQNWRILEREAQAVARLNHPNVARIFEVSEAVTSPYIVLEYIEGRSLKARMEESPDRRIEPREAASLVAQIAAGLHHVHERGLVHRDLKPANIILSREGIPKIVDFGLARHVDAKSSLSHEGALIGTLPYMSPQQCLGQPVDAQTDVYSLSVVLYELLSGRCPFEGSLGELLGRIPKGDPPPFPPDLIALRPLEEICRRGMETEPAERYSTARELAEDLERYLAGEAPRLRPPQSGWRRAIALAKPGRRRFLVGAAALGAGALVILLKRRVPEGHILVSLDTSPSGATLTFIPLDRRTGRPMPEQAVPAPTISPAQFPLRPGDYLVVAQLSRESGRFHEVYRHVPGDPGNMKGAYAFQRWSKNANGGVTLEEIIIPSKDIIQGMAKIPGAKVLPLARDSQSTENSRIQCSVPEFFVDPHEFTVADYKVACQKRFGSGPWPYNATFRSGAPDTATLNAGFEEATARAEDIGKRLLHEWEYELLATAAGRSRFPWGDEPRELALGAAGEVRPEAYASDGTAIFGLCSGAAEWVQSYVLPQPQLWSPDGAPRFDNRSMRAIRGGNRTVIEQTAPPTGVDYSPFGKLLMPDHATYPGLGFRCARSSRPSITASDFPTLLPRTSDG